MVATRPSTRPTKKKQRSSITLEAQLLQEIAARERAEHERIEAEQGLREVRERFESAFANAPIGMALVDMDGRWLQVNDALCRHHWVS